MSIESTLKSIDNSLKEVVELNRQILANLVNSAIPVTSPARETAEQLANPEPEIEPQTTIGEVVEQQLAPLTIQELEGFNAWISDVTNYLGDDGPTKLRTVLHAHGLQSLSDIGNDRRLMTAVGTSVQSLVDAKAAAA